VSLEYLASAMPIGDRFETLRRFGKEEVGLVVLGRLYEESRASNNCFFANRNLN
jgi:hypothetical protein